MQDRSVTENRELTEDERLAMFVAAHHQEHLPKLPNIPGYHVCWLTTNNAADSVYRRQQLGYTLVRPEDIQGWSYSTLKSGEHAGCIGVNEMIAAKIPLSLYQKFMMYSHHDAPNAEEKRITEQAEQVRLERQRGGVEVPDADGLADMRETSRRRAPSFVG
jgi:hypothetical protein